VSRGCLSAVDKFAPKQCASRPRRGFSALGKVLAFAWDETRFFREVLLLLHQEIKSEVWTWKIVPNQEHTLALGRTGRVLCEFTKQCLRTLTLQYASSSSPRETVEIHRDDHEV